MSAPFMGKRLMDLATCLYCNQLFLSFTAIMFFCYILLGLLSSTPLNAWLSPVEGIPGAILGDPGADLGVSGAALGVPGQVHY